MSITFERAHHYACYIGDKNVKCGEYYGMLFYGQGAMESGVSTFSYIPISLR